MSVIDLVVKVSFCFCNLLSSIVQHNCSKVNTISNMAHVSVRGFVIFYRGKKVIHSFSRKSLCFLLTRAKIIITISIALNKKSAQKQKTDFRNNGFSQAVVP